MKLLLVAVCFISSVTCKPYVEIAESAELVRKKRSVCNQVIKYGDKSLVKYPEEGSYGQNENCEWFVCTHTPTAHINITAMDVEYDTSCGYDALVINEQTYCGDSLRELNVTNVDGCTTIKFTSDSSIQKTGFRLEIEAILCNQVIKYGDKSLVKYPEEGSYGQNENCEWFVCTHTPTAHINITAMDVEYDTSCGYDALVINEQTYCGDSLRELNVTNVDGCTTIKFTSDSSIQKTGFRLEIEAIAEDDPPSDYYSKSTYHQSYSTSNKYHIYSTPTYYPSYSTSDYHHSYSTSDYYHSYSASDYYHRYSTSDYNPSYSTSDYHHSYSTSDYYHIYSTPTYYPSYSTSDYYPSYSTSDYHHSYSTSDYHHSYSTSDYHHSYSTSDYYPSYSTSDYYPRYSTSDYYHRYSTSDYNPSYSTSDYNPSYSTSDYHHSYSTSDYYHIYSAPTYYPSYSTSDYYTSYSTSDYYPSYSTSDYSPAYSTAGTSDTPDVVNGLLDVKVEAEEAVNAAKEALERVKDEIKRFN